MQYGDLHAAIVNLLNRGNNDEIDKKHLSIPYVS